MTTTTSPTSSPAGATGPPKQSAPRTDQSFLVPKEEIAANDYDLSINRYKEIVYEEIEYDPPLVILDELDAVGSGDSAGHGGTAGDVGVITAILIDCEDV